MTKKILQQQNVQLIRRNKHHAFYCTAQVHHDSAVTDSEELTRVELLHIFKMSFQHTVQCRGWRWSISFLHIPALFCLHVLYSCNWTLLSAAESIVCDIRYVREKHDFACQEGTKSASHCVRWHLAWSHFGPSLCLWHLSLTTGTFIHSDRWKWKQQTTDELLLCLHS